MRPDDIKAIIKANVCFFNQPDPEYRGAAVLGDYRAQECEYSINGVKVPTLS